MNSLTKKHETARQAFGFMRFLCIVLCISVLFLREFFWIVDEIHPAGGMLNPVFVFLMVLTFVGLVFCLIGTLKDKIKKLTKGAGWWATTVDTRSLLIALTFRSASEHAALRPPRLFK
jgi:apolipoprotein N-acyltransferase